MTGWSVKMPTEPQARDLPAQTRGMKNHTYLCQEVTSSYSLVCWSIPKPLIDAEKAAYEKAIAEKTPEEAKRIPKFPLGLLLKVSGLRKTTKLLHNEPITKKGIVGLEQVAVDSQVKIGGSTFPKVVTYRRMLFHDNMVAVASATMSKGSFQEDTKKSKRIMIEFLDSCTHESKIPKDN